MSHPLVLADLSRCSLEDFALHAVPMIVSEQADACANSGSGRNNLGFGERQPPSP